MRCGKVYGDFGNFAVGADAHGRTPDADPGGDDAGHILNADHTAGILPADACGEVAWKELSVMGVPESTRSAWASARESSSEGW